MAAPFSSAFIQSKSESLFQPSQQDAWAWALPAATDELNLSSVSSSTTDTPPPIISFATGDDSFSTEFVLGGFDLASAAQQQFQLPDPPLFPPTLIAPAMGLDADAMFFDASNSFGTSPLDNTVSPLSSSLSPPSSAPSPLNEDLRWGLQSTLPSSVSAEDLGMMSDPEFQFFAEGFLPEVAPPSISVPAGGPMLARNFALLAFPPLDELPSVTQTEERSKAVHSSSPPTPTPSPPPSGGGQFVCDTCGRTCPTLHSLRKHQRTHTRPFLCRCCGLRHAAKKDLHRHLWIKHPQEAAQANVPQEVATCHVCGKYTSRQDNVKRHIRTRHPGAEA